MLPQHFKTDFLRKPPPNPNPKGGPSSASQALLWDQPEVIVERFFKYYAPELVSGLGPKCSKRRKARIPFH